jgi:hypothetical protein
VKALFDYQVFGVGGVGTMQSDIPVSIRLLGCPQVVAQNDSSVSASRGLCPLALLGLTSATRLRRIQFVAQFWDSADTASRLGNVRQTLLRTLKEISGNIRPLGHDRLLWLTETSPVPRDVCMLHEWGDGHPQQSFLDVIACAGRSSGTPQGQSGRLKAER